MYSRQPSLPTSAQFACLVSTCSFVRGSSQSKADKQSAQDALLLRQPVVVMQVCPSTGQPCDCTAGMQMDSSESKQVLADLKPEKPPMEPIFPAELRRRQPSELHLPGPLADWYRYAAAADDAAAAAAAAAAHITIWGICIYLIP